MRRFHLQRDEDASGVSGTGVVAEGVEFTDGSCALRWRTTTASTAVYDSAEDLVAIHGHEGRTRLVWLDESPYAGGGQLQPTIRVEFRPDDNREFARFLGRRQEIIAKLRKAHP